MIQVQRSKPLTDHTHHAEVMGVADQLRQAICADETLLLRRPDNNQQPIEVITCSADKLAQDKNQMDSPSHILSRYSIWLLANTRTDDAESNIHFFNNGQLWSDQENVNAPCEAIRLVFEISGHSFIFIWLRRTGRAYTIEQQQACKRLLMQITSMQG